MEAYQISEARIAIIHERETAIFESLDETPRSANIDIEELAAWLAKDALNQISRYGRGFNFNVDLWDEIERGTFQPLHYKDGIPVLCRADVRRFCRAHGISIPPVFVEDPMPRDEIIKELIRKGFKPDTAKHSHDRARASGILTDDTPASEVMRWIDRKNPRKYQHTKKRKCASCEELKPISEYNGDGHTCKSCLKLRPRPAQTLAEASARERR